MPSETYDDALNALGTLISKQRRTNGLKWEEAFAAMHIFLEVCYPPHAWRLYPAEVAHPIKRQCQFPAIMRTLLAAEAEAD